MTQLQQITVKEHLFGELALATFTFGSCTYPTETFIFTYFFLSVPISICYPQNCCTISPVNYFQRFQRQIYIFNNPDWRSCSHFRIPYTLQSSGNLPWCSVTEATIPFLLVGFLPIYDVTAQKICMLKECKMSRFNELSKGMNLGLLPTGTYINSCFPWMDCIMVLLTPYVLLVIAPSSCL